MSNASVATGASQEGISLMSTAGPLRLILRTTADVCVGLILFLTFALAVSAYQRHSDATHRLGGLLAVSSSAGELLKFTLDDSPLIAAAVVATAVPVPRAASLTSPRHVTKKLAWVLFGCVFSGIVAFNLAFFRHLRREYASPR
jgi:hypothetical protein